MVNGVTGYACADTGTTHSIAGERLYKPLPDVGTIFEETVVSITLSDGLRKETNVHQATITVRIEGRTTSKTILALPGTAVKRTLVHIDFLNRMENVLKLRSRSWYFQNNPRHKIPFSDDPFTTTPEISTPTVVANSVMLRERSASFCNSKKKT